MAEVQDDTNGTKTADKLAVPGRKELPGWKIMLVNLLNPKLKN